jgi:Na+-driven multidrug efflux pump
MPRFRDSWLIRIGVGIIGFWVAAFLVLAGADYFFGYNPEMGPTGIWVIFCMAVALALIIIGIGQTVVRRRSQRDG